MFKTHPIFKACLLSALLATAFQAHAQSATQPAAAAPAAAADNIKVVYHMSEGIPQASRGLNNIRNHLDADPTAKIVVVTHGLGIDFLLDGATNQMEQPFSGSIAALVARGVEFRVCNNTLVARKLDASKLVMEAQVVPAGVNEVARLQAREGYVYLRP